ncbi:MAG: VPS10 domain-containing protein [Chitinophagales bacterium]
MTRYHISIVAMAFLFAHISWAQSSITPGSWPVMKNSPDFFEIQNRYYETYDSMVAAYELFGFEYNPNDDMEDKFKRWEYLMKTRVDANGNFPDPGIVFKETARYKELHPEFYAGARSAAWYPVGTADVPSAGGGAGRINAIILDPVNPDIIYVGAASGGIWRSQDAGTTWEALGDALPVTSIADIAIDPTNTDIIYVATGDGAGYEIDWQVDDDFWGGVYTAGILKSTDGGATWNPTGLSYLQDELEIVQALEIHDTNPDILIASTRNGIFRTADGGDTWTLVDATHCYDLAVNTSNPDIMYAVADEDVLVSTDAGATWSILENNLGNGGRTSIETTEADADIIFVLNQNNGFWRSTDGGATWENQKDPGAFASFYGYYDMQFDASPVDPEHLMTGGLQLARNSTGGDNNWATTSSWTGSGSDYVHADAHCFAYHPTDPDLVYAGTDGGIFVTFDHGDTWEDLSDGLRIAQIYRLSTGQHADDRTLSGWQDNGSNLWDGSSWEEIDNSTYDGMEAIIDFTDADIMFINHQYGDLKRTENGGASWTYEKCCGGWVTPVVMDPTDHNIMYYGDSGGDVFKSTNNGTSWTNKNSNLTGEVYSIAVAPDDPDVVYAASFTKVKVSDNGGDSWTNTTDFIPAGTAVNYLAVSDTDPMKVYAAISAYSEGDKVYYSGDGGSSWTNISGTLPNVPVNTIVYENGSDDRLYVGTDIGVFTKDNADSDWEPYMEGLPNVMVHELEINYTRQKLVAATYGRGIWESDLYDAIIPTLATSVDMLSYCPAATLTVSYLATGVYTITNIFTAQLSDATGSFATPVNIGSITSSDLSGSIACTLPASAELGTGYRIRVVSSAPALTGLDNGADISISCPPPAGLITDEVTETNATISWDAVDCAASYNVYYREVGTSAWMLENTTTITYTIEGLDEFSSYEWTVSSVCVPTPDLVESDLGSLVEFQTLQGVGVTDAEMLEQSFTIHPNPVISSATIEFALLQAANVTLRVTDISGKTVHVLLNEMLNAGKHVLQLDKSSLPTGNYMLELSTEKNIVSRSVVIE